MSAVEHRLQRVFDAATLVAALLTPVAVIALALDPPVSLRPALQAVNWACWAVFVVETVVMVAVARDHLGWTRRRPLSPVLALLTAPALGGLDLFRLARLLRGRVGRRAAETATTAAGLRYVAMLALLTVGLGGVLFARLEPDVGVGDGIYWAVTTITTTGYGDIVPTTSSAKILAVYVMLVGAAFLAIITGAIAQRFIQSWRAAHGEPEDPGEAAVLAKLDEIADRLAAVERSLERPR